HHVGARALRRIRPAGQTPERELLHPCADFHGAKPSLKKRLGRRVEPIGFVLAGYRPGAAHIPAGLDEVAEIGVVDALAVSRGLELHELRFDRRGTRSDAHLDAETPARPLDPEIRMEEIRPEDGSRPESRDAFGDVARGCRDADLEIGKEGRAVPERLDL